MAYEHPVAKLTLDNPHADLIPAVLGLGRDWQAREPREYGKGFSVDLAGDYGWQYRGITEYIEPLKGIAPLGDYTLADMVVADWTVDNGTWRELGPVGAIRKKYLHYYDGNAGNYAGGDFGQVTSEYDYWPNLRFWWWRYPSGQDETDPAIIEISLRGDGAHPYYALQFPAQSLTSTFYEDRFNLTGAKYDRPILAGFAAGSSTHWSIIDECQHSGGPQIVQGTNTTALAQTIQIEYLDGWLLVRMDGMDGPWAYRGPWNDDAGVEHEFVLTPGKIRVAVIGHTACFNMGQLAYPTLAYLYPRHNLYAGPLFSQVPLYRLTKTDNPPTSEITVAAVGPTAYISHPDVTFTATDGTERGVLYNVMEYRAAIPGAGTSSPVETQANDALQLERISGEMSDAWRGATMRAELYAKPGSSLPTYKGNELVKAEVSTDDGVSYDTQFTGFVVPLEKARHAGVEVARLTIEATDRVEARLRKKFMVQHSSYEGWPIDDAFEHILNRADVPAAKIVVDATVSLASMGAAFYLPVTDPKGERSLRFDESTCVVDALDDLVGTRGLQWGVNQDDECFLRPRPAYGGTPDFTLDEDTVTPEDVIADFRAARTLDDFANIIVLMVGQGAQMQIRWLVNMASIITSTADDFIGDVWQAVELVADGDAYTMERTAQALWERKGEVCLPIYFSLNDHPDLYPDMFVEVDTVSDVDVTAADVFRITRKAWSWNGPLYVQEFEAVHVRQEGT